MYSDFEKIKLFEHAKNKLYAGTLTENDFRVIVDECAKSPFEIITQKIKKMGETAIEELKLRIQKEEELRSYSKLCKFDDNIVATDVLD